MDEQFSNHLNWFQKHIDSRRRMLPIFTGHAGNEARRARDDLFTFIEEHCSGIERDDKEIPTRFRVPVELNSRYRKIRGLYSDHSLFFRLLPKMTFVSLVSIYDAYLSRLLKLIFTIKPEILNNSERQFSFKDINDFDSFEDMKTSIIEAEIDSFLRKSHSEQFKWLETKIGGNKGKLKLTKGLKNWGSFIELTERRNLLVHNDGIVNKHYIKVCMEHGIPPEKSVGEQLDVDSDYYRDACKCIYEVGIKLGHVLWRKLKPTEVSCKEADENFINLIYNLLVSKDYDLAIKLCELAEFKIFQDTITDHQSLFYIKINHAIAFKGSGEQKKCEEVLDEIDFSPLSDILKMANFVLRERYTEAAALMPKLAKSDDFQDAVYKAWPLFQWFIKTNDFNKAYEEIYGETFTISEDTSDLKPEEESDEN